MHMHANSLQNTHALIHAYISYIITHTYIHTNSYAHTHTHEYIHLHTHYTIGPKAHHSRFDDD